MLKNEKSYFRGASEKEIENISDKFNLDLNEEEITTVEHTIKSQTSFYDKLFNQTPINKNSLERKLPYFPKKEEDHNNIFYYKCDLKVTKIGENSLLKNARISVKD